jgi:hypothetical protein
VKTGLPASKRLFENSPGSNHSRRHPRPQNPAKTDDENEHEDEKKSDSDFSDRPLKIGSTKKPGPA